METIRIRPAEAHDLPALHALFERCPYPHFLQDPDWICSKISRNLVLAAFSPDDSLVAFFGLEYKGWKTYHLGFGPVVSEPAAFNALLALAGQWLKKEKKAVRFTVQLPVPETAPDYHTICSRLPEIKHRQSPKFFNWATLIVDLNRPVEEIAAGFSSHHRRNISRAKRLGVSYQVLHQDQDVDTLAALYLKMYRHRKLVAGHADVQDRFREIFRIMRQSGRGIAVGAFQHQTMMGGLLLPAQGDSLFYYAGATDPDLRQIPLLHGAFLFGMEEAQHKGFKNFDLGGFDLKARPGSPTDKINRFKLGFGAPVCHYIPLLVFDLHRLASQGIETTLTIRNALRR